ncbi:hypothetical protein CH300_05410 [Rhodococcus sp. 15-1154-1]|nr:hypothetical protein CH300_05410 [Rhodococcus sp. 15-1154-1]
MKKSSAALALVASLGLVTACGGGTGSGDAMTFVSWGGDGQDLEEQYWTTPFAEQNGITVVQDGPTDYAKIQAMVEAGNVSWDVVQVDSSVAINQCDKFFEPLDTSAVDMSRIDDSVKFTECGLPVLQQGYVMVYNTDLFGDNPPTSMADFYDTSKYPGKRGIYNYATPGQFEMALLADGVPADQMYPVDYERALDKLGTIRDDISWYGTTAQSVEQLNSGSVAMSLVYSGRAYTAAQDGAPYAPVWSTGYRSTDQLVIPKGAPHAQAAQQFLNYIAQPGPQEALAAAVPYSPTITRATVEQDALATSFSPTSPSHIDQTHVVDQAWWGANVDVVDQAWTAWQAG